LLVEIAGTTGRASLQAVGADLDVTTNGGWVADALSDALSQLDPQPECVVVDSVRIREQVAVLAKRWNVLHVHLIAPLDVLAARYGRSRSGRDFELPSYAAVAADATEAQVDTLAAAADVVVNTAESAPNEVVLAVAAALAGSPDVAQRALAA